MTAVGQPPVSAIVLAGGRSTRFGGDKLAARIGAGTLLERAVGAVADLCAEVVVVIARDGTEPPVGGLSPTTPVRVLRDPVAGGGPLVGLAAGLDAASGPIVLAVAGDMPELVPAVLTLLVEQVATGAAAAVLGQADRYRPLPCALERGRAIEAVAAVRESGASSLRALLAALAPVVIAETAWRALDPEGRTLLDVDRREDLDRLDREVRGLSPPGGR